MDSIYSIVHITIPSRYEKIMEDGYLCPFRSVHGTGIFCFIQKKKDQWKEITNFRWFGNCAVELNKDILLQRNDYIIRNSDDTSGMEIFGGDVIYNAKNNKDKKKLSSSLHKLTKLNEIRFKNKISLKKYMINK
jgi:hypothetical protein